MVPIPTITFCSEHREKHRIGPNFKKNHPNLPRWHHQVTISDMFHCIDGLTDHAPGHGASDQEIADARHALGVQFREDYEAFLSKFGWAMIHGDTLYGLGADVPHGFTVVKNAFSERYEAHPHIPTHLVPIMNDGAGNNYCLDTLHFQDDECPVVFWDHEHDDGPDQTPRRVSLSFDRWLIDRIADKSHADEA